MVENRSFSNKVMLNIIGMVVKTFQNKIPGFFQVFQVENIKIPGYFYTGMHNFGMKIGLIILWFRESWDGFGCGGPVGSAKDRRKWNICLKKIWILTNQKIPGQS